MAENRFSPKTHSLFEQGEAFREMKDYPRSRAFYEEAVEMAKHETGELNPALYPFVMKLAAVLEQLEDYPATANAYEYAVRIAEESGSEFNLAIALDRLAQQTHLSLRNLAAARALYERTLKLVKAVAPEGPWIIRVYEDFALAISEENEKRELAIPLLEEALPIAEIVYGSNSTQTADISRELGCLYNEKSDFISAEKCIRRAISIFKEHPEGIRKIYTSACALAKLLTEIGEYPEAEALHLRSIAICESIPYSQLRKWCELGIRFIAYSRLLDKTGRFAEAEEKSAAGHALLAKVKPS